MSSPHIITLEIDLTSEGNLPDGTYVLQSSDEQVLVEIFVQDGKPRLTHKPPPAPIPIPTNQPAGPSPQTDAVLDHFYRSSGSTVPDEASHRRD